MRREEQVAPLREMGAAHGLDLKSQTYADDLARVLKEEKPTVFLDAVTGPDAARIFEAMGTNARWVVYGRLDAEPARLDRPEELIFKRKRIEGFWLTDWFAKASLVRKARATRAVQNRFLEGRWRTDVTAVVPLGDALERVPAELARGGGKVFVRP